MNKNTVSKLAVLALLWNFHTAQALPLLNVKLPGNSANFSSNVGSLFDANIFVDAVPDLGGFDFTLTFDNTKLSAQSFDTASIFGAANTETLANTAGPGNVRLSDAISGLSPLTQGLNITAPTLLGTVHFKALSTAVNSSIDFLVNADTPVLSAFDGTSVAGSKQNAFVQVKAAVVPLPASLVLFAPALMWAGALMRKRQANSGAL